MNRSQIIMLVFVVSLLTRAAETSAQPPDISELLADGQRRQQQIQDWNNQQLAIIQQKIDQGKARVIRDYRQQTGDHTTSDADVYARLENEYYRRNPAAYQQRIAEDQYVASEMRRIQAQMHADNMAGFQARSQIIANTANEVNAMSMNGFRNRMAGMDRMQVMNVNAINEQTRYFDPATGQAVDLSFHPGQWQSVGGQSYYTDGWGRQFAYYPGYGFQLLNEFSP